MSPAKFRDSAQSTAADPKGSVWVAASAGTGKTKVLTDRVLRLLLAGTPPARLLCLTFTRAAAAEMATRINLTLGDWTTMEDSALDATLAELTGVTPAEDLRHLARRLFARALDAPGGLKIMTIHAFCQSLLARFPLEAEVTPRFEVMEERAAAEMLAASQREIIGLAAAGEDAVLADALNIVAADRDESRFAELMTELRDARVHLQPLFDRGIENAVADTYRLLGVAPSETVQTVIANACAEDRFDRNGLVTAAGTLSKGSITDQGNGRRLADWLARDADQRVEYWAAYFAVFITAEGTPRKRLITKKSKASDPSAEDVLRAEQTRLVKIAERLKAVRVACNTAALLRLGGALLECYERHKRSQALLDYDDLIVKTDKLLSRPDIAPWVLYKLDGGIDHILVDEAQDTSPRQWRVIAALADEFFAGEGARAAARTVFVVGDEKQSIFSFQGADLNALESMRAYFAARAKDCGQDWNQVPLTVSFRSTEPVLCAVDAVIAAAPEGVARGAVRHQAHRTGHAGLVELWPPVVPRELEAEAPWTPPVVRRRGDSPPQRLAERIAGTIDAWLADGEILESRGRPIQAGDIMILVRRRDALVVELMRALKKHQIAVAGADRMRLNDQLAVMDLVALGKFLLLPEDDLTLATVLKGPLIGLTEDQLFALAHGRAGNLWQELSRRRSEQDAFARAYDWLAEALARTDAEPPYELYTRILFFDGGRRKLVARLGPEAEDAIDEFLAETLRYGRIEVPSLQGFLHWLTAHDVPVKRDMEQGRDQVRVMTVHGAKGLQAPIVFLPDTMSVPRSRDQILRWCEGDRDVLLWPGRKADEEAICAKAREMAQECDEAEYRRLLYVAMTRAEDRLYVCGWQGGRAPSEDCWYRLVEKGLETVTHRRAEHGIVLRENQNRPAESDDTHPAMEPESAEPPVYLETPPAREPAPTRSLAPSRPRFQDPAVLSPLAGADDGRFQRGRLIHALLQKIPVLPEAGRAAACRRFLADPAHGLTQTVRDEIADNVMALLRNPAFEMVFAPESRAEVPLIGVVEGTVISGQVDRLIVEDDKILAVDFKTNRPVPRQESEVPDAYLHQMAGYRALLRKAFPGREVACALAWTDGPTLMPLSSSTLDRQRLDGDTAKP